MQSTYSIMINGISLPSGVIDLDGVQIVARIFTVDAQSLHFPFRIGQAKCRVAKEDIAFFHVVACALPHTVHIAQTIQLFTIDTE